jgi:exonuclease III
MSSGSILVWNVCGLNARARRDIVRELVASEHPSIVCLQETKLHVISPFDLMQIVGPGFEYFYLPAEGTRGGILLAWRASVWSVSSTSLQVYSISALFKPAAGGSPWWMTAVYGPCSDGGKVGFLAELHNLRAIRSGPWLLCGDFNMVYRAKDKNNGRVNRRLMGQFRSFLNAAALKELHLNGRLFTWSNERTHPTLERIDRAFISNEWEDLFPANELHSLSSLCSDHVLLLLQTDASFVGKGRFQFRAFWPRCAGFLDVVQRAWHCPLHEANLFKRLDWLLRNSARFLKSWNDRFVGNVRLQMEIA